MIRQNIHSEDWSVECKEWHADIKRMLRSDFGHTEFRDGQLEIINASLAKKDIFVLLPTGAGKSLTFQLPALYEWESAGCLTVVVSPLKSLMLDQCNRLDDRDIPNSALNSSKSTKEMDEGEEAINNFSCGISMLYVTPETLLAKEYIKERLLDYYRRGKLARFVIDEAHSITEVGEDFRKSYGKLLQLRLDYPGVPFTLATATATEENQNDILKSLNIEEYELFVPPSIDRRNISLYVKKTCPESRKMLIESICKSDDFVGKSGIVFCITRKNADNAANYYSKKGISCSAYHAGMTNKKRESVQRAWTNDEIQVIFATTAFGLGIDKNNVRFIIHSGQPPSVESYFQQIGRAGRDGNHSHAFLFSEYSDFRSWVNIIVQDNLTETNKPEKLKSVNDMYEFINQAGCRRANLLHYFGEKYIGNCHSCDSCQFSNGMKLESVDMTIVASKLFEDIEQGACRHTMLTKYAKDQRPILDDILVELISQRIICQFYKFSDSSGKSHYLYLQRCYNTFFLSPPVTVTLKLTPEQAKIAKHLREEFPNRKIPRKRRKAKDITRNFHCPLCIKSYASKAALRQHSKFKHT